MSSIFRLRIERVIGGVEMETEYAVCDDLCGSAPNCLGLVQPRRTLKCDFFQVRSSWYAFDILIER